MIEDGENVSDNVTSFLLESLVWNVPNRIMNNNETWIERLKQSIVYLYENTKTTEDCKEWGEVSELLYLFHGGRKWNSNYVNQYMIQLWKLLKF